jgi:hypothetical protein
MGITQQPYLIVIVCRSLSSLIIADNDLGGAGMQALVEGLQENETLVMLDVSANGLAEEGARLLSELLRRST